MSRTYNRPSFPAIDTSGNEDKGGWYLLTPITPISESSANNRAGYLAVTNDNTGISDYLKRSNFFQMLLDNMILDDQSDKIGLSGEIGSSDVRNVAACKGFRVQPTVYYMDHTQKNYDGSDIDNPDGSMNTYGFDPNSACLPSKCWKTFNLNDLSNSGYIATSPAIDAHTLGANAESNKPVCWPVLNTSDFGTDADDNWNIMTRLNTQGINAADNRLVAKDYDNANSLLNVRVNMGTCYWVYIQKLDFPGNRRKN